MDIRFLGHACFELSEGATRALIDPFLSQNPKAAAQPGELEPTHLLLTHGHGDHLGTRWTSPRARGRSAWPSPSWAGS